MRRRLGPREWWLRIGAAAIVAVVATIALRLDSGGSEGVALGAGVIATVNGSPVYEGEVRVHLRPPEPWIGVEPPTDPIIEALDDAIEVKLFAAEAVRRGASAPTGAPTTVREAVLARKLIDSEVRRRGLRPESVSAHEARNFYRRHPELFNHVHAVRVSAIVVYGRLLAVRLLQQAAVATESSFRRLVERHSVDADSARRGGDLGVINEDNDDFPPVIARTAFWLRKPGRVGLAQLGDRYFVLRATWVGMDENRWNGALRDRVAAVLANIRAERFLDRLATRLRQSAVIVVDHAKLRQLDVPSWAQYANRY